MSSRLFPLFIFAFFLTLLGPFALNKSNNYNLYHKDQTPPFRLPLSQEPLDLDPKRFVAPASNYFFFNLMRGLYRWNSEGTPLPEQAQSCDWQEELVLRCRLKEGLQWSDGSALLAQDYVRTFHYLLAPKNQGSATPLLKNLIHYEEVIQNLMAPEKIGVKALDAQTLQFTLSRPDKDFISKLASSALTPMKNQDVSLNRVTNGPYKLYEFTPGQKFVLLPSLKYHGGQAHRPPLIFYMADDDNTVLRLYLTKELDMVRRLPTDLIPYYENKPDYFRLPLARFDYIGFGATLKKNLPLRQWLATTPDYSELKKIYHSTEQPGCVGKILNLNQQSLCYTKEQNGEVYPPSSPMDLKFGFSRAGGESVQRGMEWLQDQWHKASQAPLQIELFPTEPGSFLAQIKRNSFDIFRKGFPLERPTCLALLEGFGKTGSEGFLQVSPPELEKLLSDLAKADSSEIRATLCEEGLRRLMTDYALIPLGQVEYSLLISPHFRGWVLNPMNQLDLANLEYHLAESL